MGKMEIEPRVIISLDVNSSWIQEFASLHALIENDEEYHDFWGGKIIEALIRFIHFALDSSYLLERDREKLIRYLLLEMSRYEEQKTDDQEHQIGL
jgi:hypothetical protein